MSGPKRAEIRNWRAEIEAVRREAEARIARIEREIALQMKTMESAVDRAVRQAGDFLDDMEGKRLWQELKDDVRQFRAELESAGRDMREPFQESSSGLAMAGEVLDRIPADHPFREKFDRLHDALLKDMKKGAEIKEKMRLDMLAEAKQLYEEGMGFIREWLDDSAILKQLESLYSDIKHATKFNDMRNLLEKFRKSMGEADKKAVENNNTFEIKLGNSEHILNALEDMDFENISRTQEGGLTEDIIISAETPLGDWAVTFTIVSGSDIRLDTPEDDRCHNYLKDLVTRLEDGGLNIRIAELRTGERENRKTGVRKKVGQKARKRM